jgi:hypothetical protein
MFYQTSTRYCMTGLRQILIFAFVFVSVCLNAQEFPASQQTDDQLLSHGNDNYSKNQYAAAAVYFYAYLQRKPARLTNLAFKNDLYAALNYSLQQAVVKKGTAGLDDKADGVGNTASAKKPAPPAKGAAVTAINIKSTGHWTCNDGGIYYIHQVGNDVWWYGQSPGASSTNGFANVMHGRIDVTTNKIVGHWADVPSGGSANSGEITLQIINPKKIIIVSQTGGFSGKEWNAAASTMNKNATSAAANANMKKGQ